MLNLGAKVIVGLYIRPLEELQDLQDSLLWSYLPVFLEGSCMKYLNTLNKVQIDQKSEVGLPTVSAYCLTITLNFSLC